MHGRAFECACDICVYDAGCACLVLLDLVIALTMRVGTLDVRNATNANTNALVVGVRAVRECVHAWVRAPAVCV
jgi:hypothetical protein